MRITIPPAVLCLLAIGDPLVAQQSPPQVFRTETEAILVTATVIDREGRLVTDVRREDLRLFEDGAPQEIAQIENAHRGGVDQIDAAVVEIARELRVQYAIAYYPTNSRKDGKFRRLKVETTRPGVEVRARSGYWAPREPS